MGTTTTPTPTTTATTSSPVARTDPAGTAPATGTGSGRPAGRRHLLLALLTALGLLVAASPAHAYTTSSRSGVPVAPVVYAVQGSHYSTGSAVTGPMYRPWIYQAGPVVYRAAGTGQQSVRVVYRVDRWNGSSWVLRHSASGAATIASGVPSAKAPNLSLLPTDGSGYYRVRVEMTWTNGIGAYLGHMNVTMNGTGDYRCSTTRTCSTSASWVYLGA
jgi:hypothetical protein